MTDHDPLCLYSDDGYGSSCEVCRVIEEVRAEERERIAQAIEALPNNWLAAVGAVVVRAEAARIARNGGRDD